MWTNEELVLDSTTTYSSCWYTSSQQQSIHFPHVRLHMLFLPRPISPLCIWSPFFSHILCVFGPLAPSFHTSVDLVLLSLPFIPLWTWSSCPFPSHHCGPGPLAPSLYTSVDLVILPLPVTPLWTWSSCPFPSHHCGPGPLAHSLHTTVDLVLLPIPFTPLWTWPSCPFPSHHCGPGPLAHSLHTTVDLALLPIPFTPLWTWSSCPFHSHHCGPGPLAHSLHTTLLPLPFTATKQECRNTDPCPSVQPVFHDADELLVA